MRIVILLLALAGSLFLPTSLYADAQKKDWLGTWEMNHDDHIGALSITDSPVSCVTTPWCDLLLHYTGNGQKFTGRILTIDDHWQHITFVISFPGNAQKFDGYIFSGNKNTIAGTTYWGGRTFGFYATRRKAGGPGAGTPNERVNGPGTLRELREVASRIKPERLLAGRVNKPQFFLSGNSFVYYEGDPVSLTDEFGYSDPFANLYLTPLARLIAIDDLRRFINRRPESDPVFVILQTKRVKGTADTPA